MRGAPFAAMCLRHGLQMNDLIKYGPHINYAAIPNEEAEKILKQIKKKKEKALNKGKIWSIFFK